MCSGVASSQPQEQAGVGASVNLRILPDSLRIVHMQVFTCLELACERKEAGTDTFSYFGPHIWNNLPQDISLPLAISTFSPVGSLSSNGVRIRVLVHSTGIVRNELMHGYANVVHTSN